MSQNNFPWGPGDEPRWPDHSERCLFTQDMCYECYGVLAPIPIRQRPKVHEMYQAYKRGVPAPLSETFMNRLRATLALYPKKYAPIFQFLVNYQGGE